MNDKPRENIISWDEYFMAVAQLIKSRSKDPVTQVGACVVKDNKILSTGYNGFPNNISDYKYPWGKNSDKPWENKFFYVVHAELNAILACSERPQGATLYVTKFPCNECAKAIIQSGISTVIYYESDDDFMTCRIDKQLTLQILQDAGIQCDKFRIRDFLIEIKI